MSQEKVGVGVGGMLKEGDGDLPVWASEYTNYGRIYRRMDNHIR